MKPGSSVAVGRDRTVLVLALLLHFFASTMPGPSWIRGLAALAGILLILFAVRRMGTRPSQEGPPVPWVFVAFVGTAGFLSRFIHLTDFSFWPLYDEGISALYAMDNQAGWDGRLTYYFSALPPLYIWMQAISFKLLGIGKGSLWVLPAILAAASWLVLWFAAGRVFSRGESFRVMVLLAFGYSMLLPGRLAHPYGSLMAWQCIGIFGVAFFVTSGLYHRPGWMFLGGLYIGLGSLTFFTWFWIAPVLLGLTLFLFRWEILARRDRPAFASFLMGMVLGALPSIPRLLDGAYGGHALTLFRDLFDPVLLPERLWHFTALFWTSMDSFRYGPFWGGLFNPIETTLFFMGVAAVLFQERNRGWHFVLYAWVLLLLPVLATWPANGTRLIHLVPFTYLLILRGSRQIPMGKKGSGEVLAGLLILSSMLNLYHFWGPARRWSTQPVLGEHQRMVEHSRAYDLCARKAEVEGSLYLFTRLNAAHFNYQSLNPALYVLTSPFNGLTGPKHSTAPRWAAVLTNDHHRAYLSRRFRNAEWHELSDTLDYFTSTYCLGFIPVSSLEPGTLQAWIDAENALQSQYRSFLEDRDLERAPERAKRRFISELDERVSPIGKDPFLRTLYLEGRFGMGIGVLDESGLAGILAESRRGEYRSPFLLVAEGIWMVRSGRGREAEPMFDEAVRAYPPARRYIDQELDR